jgi:alkanesulfonate monooxygenase SsuD/methylene tetrahydromethanopterin reductase-like flavin-dependent oxidoreductase (luciferase family)
MNIGIGLPAAVPDVDATTIGGYAAAAEEAGFASVGVIDRLVYDNIEALTALAAAAARTERVELITTVLTVGWRGNAALVAKQMASVDLLSGGRLTAGIGLGGWPADYAESGVPETGKGARLEQVIDAVRDWPYGDPTLLFGGLVPAAWKRAATRGEGWVSPLFGMETLETGAQAVRGEWAAAGRDGEPRIMTGRYFSLGDDADAVAKAYIRHYYGDEYLDVALADTLTTPARLADELARLEAAGVTDVVLYPCSPGIDQVALLAQAARP